MNNKQSAILVVYFLLFFTGCQTAYRQPAGAASFSPFEGRKDAFFSPSGTVDCGSVAYSPDGLFYAGEVEPYGEGNIGVHDADNGDILLKIKAQDGKNDIKSLAWSPDGLVIAVMYHGGSPSGIVFYDTASGERLRRLEISEDYHFMVFGKTSQVLYLSKDSIVYRKVNLRNTGFAKYSGCNLPWINYGWDVGRNPWGGEHKGFSANKGRLYEDFSFLMENGAGIVRVFIFCDMRSGMIFDESGFPVRFDEFVEEDFMALLDAAEKTGLLLIPVVFDYTIADGVMTEDVSEVGEYPQLFIDNAKKKALLKIFGGFFRKFGSHPSVFAWDIINEPEHLRNVPEEKIYGFVKDFIYLLRRNAPRGSVTVGLLNRNSMAGWIESELDIYQFHYFDSFESDYPLNYPVVKLGLDKPVIAGELETTDIPGKLTVVWKNGYKGGLFWALNDGGFRENARLFRSWMSVH
ncbi:MAG TPA: WD40 repeat domain-containing protein [bacterium]|nr:WD40 repeat domain-containing protein [bacterium]